MQAQQFLALALASWAHAGIHTMHFLEIEADLKDCQ